MPMSNWRRAIHKRPQVPSDCSSCCFEPGTNEKLMKPWQAQCSSMSTRSFISGDATFYGRRQQIAELAIRYKLPTCCPYHDQAAAGCLMSYGASISDTQRQAGKYAGRILKGERPADLPVLQPTKFELVINRKTA